MGFELSPRTARKVKALLNKGDDTGTLSTDGRGSARYDTHVKITGPKDEGTGLYPCLPTYYDPALAAWVEFEEQRVKAANDEKLVEDRRYRAINYGVDDDYLVFVADEGLNLTDGCYITLTETTDEDGDPVTLVDLNIESLPGCGLTIQEDSGSGSGDDCPKLAVDVPALTGCGIKVQEPDSGSEDECDKFAVDVDALVDTETGLIVVPADSGEECDKIGIDLEVASEVTIGPFLTDLSLTVEGCNLKLKGWEQVFTVGFNAAGMPVAIVEGPAPAEETEAGSVNLSSLCHCCSSSSTSSYYPSSDYPSSSYVPECTGPSYCSMYTVEPHGEYPGDTLTRVCMAGLWVWQGTHYTMYPCGGGGFCLRYPAAVLPDLITGRECAWNGPDAFDSGCGIFTPTTVGGWDCGEVEVCCGGSSSSSAPSSSSSPPEDECAGWYCCEDTETVVYLANCAAVAAYACAGGEDPEPGVDCAAAPYLSWGVTYNFTGDGWVKWLLPSDANVDVTHTGSTGGTTLSLFGGTNCTDIEFIDSIVTDGTTNHTISGTLLVAQMSSSMGGAWTIRVDI